MRSTKQHVERRGKKAASKAANKPKVVLKRTPPPMNDRTKIRLQKKDYEFYQELTDLVKKIVGAAGSPTGGANRLLKPKRAVGTQEPPSLVIPHLSMSE